MCGNMSVVSVYTLHYFLEGLEHLWFQYGLALPGYRGTAAFDSLRMLHLKDALVSSDSNPLVVKIPQRIEDLCLALQEPTQQVTTQSVAFLGSVTGCSVCHLDHKLPQG